MNPGNRLESIRSALVRLSSGRLFGSHHVRELISEAGQGNPCAVHDLCDLLLSSDTHLADAARQGLMNLPEEGIEACCDHLFRHENEPLRELCCNNSYLPDNSGRRALFRIVNGERFSSGYSGPPEIAEIAGGYLKATWSERLRIIRILTGSGRPDLLSGVLGEPGCNGALPVDFISLMAEKFAARGNFSWLASNLFSLPFPAAVIAGRLLRDSGYTPDDGDPDYWKALAESLPGRYDFPEFPQNMSAPIRGGSVRYQLLAMNMAGTLLAAGCYDGTIELWRIPGGGLLTSRGTDLERIHSLKFSPDGSCLACLGGNGRILLISVPGLEILSGCGMNAPSPSALDWLNSDVIVGGTQGLPRSVTLPNGRIIRFISPPSSAGITSFAIGEKGKIFYGDCQGSVSAWDPAGGTTHTFSGIHNGPVVTLVLNKSGSFLSSTSVTGSVLVHSIDSGQIIGEIADDVPVSSVVISPDATWCATGDGSGNLSIFNLPECRMKSRSFVHRDGVSTLGVSSDSKLVIVGTTGGFLHFHDVQDSGRAFTVRTGTGGIHCIAATANGTIAITGWQGVLELRQLSDGSLLQRHEGRSGPISCSSTPSSKGLVALSGRNGFVQILDPGCQTFYGSVDTYLPVVTAVALLEKEVLVAGRDGTLLLLSLPRGDIIRSFPGHEGTVRALAVCSEKRLFAAGGWDCGIRLHGILKDNPVLLAGHGSPITGLSFFPSGRFLVSCSQDRTLRLWDLEQQYESKVLTGHTSVVSAVAVSPAGDTIASGSWDRSVRLWSVPDGDCLAALRGHHHRLTNLQFCSGNILVTGDEAGWLGFWLLPDGKLLRLVDTRAGHIIGIIPGIRERSVLTVHRKGVCLSFPCPWTNVAENLTPGDLVAIRQDTQAAEKSSAEEGDRWRFIECLAMGSLRSSVIVTPDPTMPAGYEIVMSEET